jgi:16S rRNA (adenine1518-N6/adenine1519-N6)-dimethyltransferase
VHPKKSLGQHWLFDEESLRAMSEAAEVNEGDSVLEVGPGLGTLTEVLLSVGASVTAVEFDRELFERLTNEMSKFSEAERARLTVVNEDILKYDLTQLPKNYKVAANIPYYLTSNLIRRLLESPNPPSVMALLIQKEVAERIVAQPGQMSILAVATQYYAEVALKNLVPASLFTPPPKVDSQIIQIRRRLAPLFRDVDISVFFRIVRAGFSEKRKMLRSALSGGLQITKPAADQLLQQAGIKSSARAQELSLEQWHQLYLSYQAATK